mgnify:CR=1 FL=1
MSLELGYAGEARSCHGGGAAGVVYETIDCETGVNYALKILHPIGYKLMPPRASVPVPGAATGSTPSPSQSRNW